MPALPPACVFSALRVGNERDVIDENRPVGMVCNNGRRSASGYSALFQRSLARVTGLLVGQFWLRYFLPSRMSQKQATFRKKIQLQTPKIVEQFCIATTRSDCVMPNQCPFNWINLTHTNKLSIPKVSKSKRRKKSKYHVDLSTEQQVGLECNGTPIMDASGITRGPS